MNKIKLAPVDLPSVEFSPDGLCTGGDLINGYTYSDGYKLDYGLLRGSQVFQTEKEANQELLDFIQNRIHSVAHELEALCKLQRKILRNCDNQINEANWDKS